jgi:hypothetical protein
MVSFSGFASPAVKVLELLMTFAANREGFTSDPLLLETSAHNDRHRHLPNLRDIIIDGSS